MATLTRRHWRCKESTNLETNAGTTPEAIAQCPVFRREDEWGEVVF
jgi:hypothetical protein